MRVVLRPTQPADIPAIVELQRQAFPPPFPEDHLWQASHLRNHLAHYPKGQYVVEKNGEIVGSMSNLRVTLEKFQRSRNWDDVTGGFDLTNHSDRGEILFGADIAIAPAHRRQGIGRSLYVKRYEMVRDNNMLMYATFVRMPDFCDSGIDDPEAYIQEVLDGERIDRTLNPILAMGLKYETLLRDGLNDPESGNAMAVLTWRP